MRISDWSSDVCSSDLFVGTIHLRFSRIRQCVGGGIHAPRPSSTGNRRNAGHRDLRSPARAPKLAACKGINREICRHCLSPRTRSEEHTSELQSLMRTSYAALCLTKQKKYSHKRNSHRNKNTRERYKMSH